jgi:hypothetical protein
VIQKRDDDLVVATFGRGFYVLDDLDALRAATPAVLASDATLLPVPRAAMYAQSNVFAPGVNGWSGSDFWRAPNPPFGATFTYYLKSGLRSRRAQRQLAERGSERRGADVFYPPWDSLRAEDREEAPAVILVVTDAQGNVVRRLNGPVTAGIQRVAWDLRYAPPTLPRAAAAGDDFEGPRGGSAPLVMPGSYTVSLMKRVDGVTTPIGQPRKFDVYLLDQSLPTRSPAVIAFQQKATGLQRAMLGANALASELSSRVEALLRAVEQTPGAEPKLGSDVRARAAELRDIGEALDGDPTMSRRQEPTPPSLMGRLNVLAQSARSLEGPTGTQEHQYEIVAAEYAKIQTRLRAIAETDLRRVESAAETAGVPWTTGRIPDWKP